MFRYPSGLRHSLALASFVLMFASAAAAQEVQVLRAQYGYGDRQVDVTPRLRELARADRSFRVANDTFGVDPAPGRGKTLRIDARGPRGDTRTFEYREGSVVDRPQLSDWRGGNWDRGGRDVPEGQSQILRAEYGYGDRQVDVTPRLRDLARAERSFRVANDTFGVDPAPGRGKTLRIDARGPRGDTRTFEYREGSVVDRPQFSDWNGGGWNSPRREDFDQLDIVSAVYGASNRSVDVAARLQSLVRDNRLNLTVSNSTLDIDPAPGTHKTLSVTYSVGGGAQRQLVVGESDQLNIP